MVETTRSLMDYAPPPVSGTAAAIRTQAARRPKQSMSLMDFMSDLDLANILSGTGIPERFAAANEVLNPLAAIPRAQAASQEIFAPNRSIMQRIASTGNMLGEVGGVAVPMAASTRIGAPAATALMEGLLGGSPATQAASDAARRFLADESGSLRLFQGSPYVFDRFDLSKAGTGTGQQRYGAGVYLTDTRAAAEEYAKEAAKKGGRNIYEVSADVTPDDLIQWDKPFSEQTQKIQDLLKPLADRAVKEEAVTGYDTGGEAYQAALDGLAYIQGRDVRGKTSEELAAPLVKLLRDAGIKGAVFPDDIATPNGQSYVIYDDKLVKILSRNTADDPAQTRGFLADESGSLPLPFSTAGQATGKLDELTGLPLNADGTVTLYHGTTKQNAQAITKDSRLRSAGEPDVYLTTDKTGGGYGDGTVVAVDVDPKTIKLDDAFPNGRLDFRLPVGRKLASSPLKVTLIPFRADDPAQARGLLE